MRFLSHAAPLSLGLLCAGTQISAVDQRLRRPRQLDARDPFNFQVCVDKKLTPDQCINVIQERIIRGSHEITDIHIQIQPPRTSGNGLMEVPVNLSGEVACDVNNGMIRYNHLWEVDESTSVKLDDLDCRGLTAAQCCHMIRDYSKNVGPDVNGNTLECLVHQEPLVPLSHGKDKQLTYQDYFMLSDRCEKRIMHKKQIDETDSETREKISQIMDEIDELLSHETLQCSKVLELRENLYNDARAISMAQFFMGSLFDKHPCVTKRNGDELVGPLHPQFAADLKMMKQHLVQNHMPSSAQHKIVIYTDVEGNITKVPQLGGGRGVNYKTAFETETK